MNNLRERHEQERQMELEAKIRGLRIKRLENMMACDLDPFGPEFEEAAEKLRKLVAEQHTEGIKRIKFHHETAQMEWAADGST